ncbi:MAG: tetratricopeptide repeat protein [Bacteroidetes bacterium]|nr:tetratricopeptide repeat protein [Bacteroidota bacterium]
MNEAFNVLIVIYAALFISSPLIAIFHELGHALAYLILTKPESIDIYIGTYHKPRNSVQLKAGKLNFFIKRSFPFVKGIGLCKSSTPEVNYQRYIIILLAGSVFTFLLAATFGLIVFSTNAPFLIQISCYIFLGLSTLSLITNLVPNEIDSTYDVNLDNDGKQLFFTLKIKKSLPDYVEAIELIHQKEYATAVERLDNVLAAAPASEKVLTLLFAVSLAAKQYEGAALYLDKLEAKHELSSNNTLNKGYLQSATGKKDEAIETYSKLLRKDRHNVVALNNIGEELIEKGAHKVAAQVLEKAIKLKPMFDYPYATLGYSKLLQGDLEEGKKLIKQCMDINPNNAYAYRGLGIYYLKLNDSEKAAVHFNKALELDSGIDLSPYYEG